MAPLAERIPPIAIRTPNEVEGAPKDELAFMAVVAGNRKAQRNRKELKAAVAHAARYESERRTVVSVAIDVPDARAGHAAYDGLVQSQKLGMRQ